MNKIDCRGLMCPKPVIETKKYFDKIKEGKAEVTVDNEIANNNIIRFAEGAGFKVESNAQENNFIITITKENESKKASNVGGFSIIVGTDKLGEGNDELGKTLMKSYLYALSESNEIPDELIFLNGGVKLTTEGSNALESIKDIEKKGTKVISCGACLDFYNLKEKLNVGEVGNMYTIVEIMNTKRVVKL
ncbi:sulfurtransferase-like selenium metabolism protein YedF [uncultured Clostridium sp.]|uniref:sulfurtransferase-like selenium metabolism protein YedF n=1 Tax=uncultured Clostridium sp. TaxID=59620 RepID=UPI00261164C4|nr:sulfurtransferase-like selenium metabolism protein YedF [uncultured Clostridium sp.]